MKKCLLLILILLSPSLISAQSQRQTIDFGKITIGMICVTGSYCTYNEALQSLNIWLKNSDGLGLTEAFAEIGRQFNLISRKEMQQDKYEIALIRLKTGAPVIGWGLVSFGLFVNGCSEILDGLFPTQNENPE